MNLKKMLLLASMALAAIASAAPAAAQAQTHGLTENGSFIAAGAGVTITSTNLVTQSFAGPMTCTKVTLHYTVETNTDEHLALSPVDVAGTTTNATPEGCVVHTFGPTGPTDTVHVTPAGTDTVTFNTWGQATAVSRYTVQITGGSTCTFTGNVALQSVNGTGTVNIGPSTLNGGLCGNGTIEGTGTAETSNGTALVADIKAT